jgi:hypothetical protein
MNARRMRYRLLAAALLGLGTAAAGLPAAVAAPVPALGAVTVLTASRPLSVDVRLPRRATVSTPFGDSPDLTVSGGGRLVAFVLAGTDAATRGVTLAGGATGSGAAVRRFLMPLPAFPSPGGSSFEVVKTFADTTALPAGTYRLYVVPDGRTARVTLRLHGVSGQVSLAPVRRAVAEVVPGTPFPADTPTRTNVFAATAARHLGGRGLALQVLRSTLDGEVAWQLDMCHDNPGSVDAPPPPGCPNGEKHTLADHRAPELEHDEKLFVQGFAGLPAGNHGVSVVYTNEARATALDHLTLWLTY